MDSLKRSRFVPNKVTNVTSLDELVEEDCSVSSRSQSKGDSLRDNEADDEEDELEAYMASIENEPSKRLKHDPGFEADDEGGDKGDEEPTDKDGPDMEDLKADVEAAISGVNSSANKTIKKLQQLSNRSVTYAPFKKAFYQEVPELAQMTNEEVDELRMSLENIKVVGKHCPKPITCWPHCGLSRKIMDVLKKSNFLAPTPIQAQAIPAIMSGRDVIGIAKTGCGKTLSFLLPMFRHILAQRKLEKNDGPIAVIVTPTRELATQICDDACKFSKSLGLRVVAIYGGPNISEQIGMLKPGAEVIVCTPGRMIEILTVNSGRVTNLNRCTYLVLDEADRLFDMGFEKQIRSIVELIRPDRQTVMFSATFPSKLEAHARKMLTNPIAIQVGGRSIVCKDVHQTVEIIEEHDKFLRLLPILRKHVDEENSAIVFVSKQGKADSLLEDLMQAFDTNCLALHGGIDRDDRMSTFSSFKKGKTKVLVATSVAARGLDVKNCICVVNYDCPNHYEDYVHRCGRTGRAGNKGFAYTFITPDQGPFANDIINALQLSNHPVPAELQKLWDTYKEEAERTGKKIWATSGFSGRGFKFDEAEAQLVNEKKKYQKKSLGLQNSSDEEEEGATGEGGGAGGGGDTVSGGGRSGAVGEHHHQASSVDTAQLESEIRALVGSKSLIATPVVKVIGSSKNAAPAPMPVASEMSNSSRRHHQQSNKSSGPNASVKTAASELTDSKALSKLDLAKRVAEMLCKRKGIESVAPPPASIGPAASGLAPTPNTDPQPQVPIGVKLATPSGLVVDPYLLGAEGGGPSSTAAEGGSKSERPERLEMQMEINDFHQQVRRRLTSKDTLNKVSEQCEVGITVRGQFCPPGDRPNEPKLYLAIEATCETNLKEAHRELLLVVRDEYNRINSQPAGRGRFRIV